MKENIHPKYFEATIICAGCGSTFKTGSTIKEMKVDICSNCHPFYTGQKKLIDTEGRVEKFARRQEQRKVERKPQKAVAQPVFSKPTEAKPVAGKQAETNRPKSLREMLQEAANS